MGYTHYWKVKLDTPKQLMNSAIADCRKIMEKSGKLIGGWPGYGTPESSKKSVFFNGKGKEAHEAFSFPPSMVEGYEPGVTFTFCKTARKEYDVVVVACLAAIFDRLGQYVMVSSDGDAADWAPGVALACEALKRPIANPMEGKDD